MHVARLAHETDVTGWRDTARSLLAQGVPPEAALWTVESHAELFSPPPSGEGDRAQVGEGDLPGVPGTGKASLNEKGDGTFKVPKAFLDLASKAILHRSIDRFALLYRLLWRQQSEPNLIQIISDPDVAKALDFARNVSRAAHKMKAFVRFRLAQDDQGEAYVAWFEPVHRVTEAVAPFFMRRFTNMRWSILTPDACAHWDLTDLAFTPGANPQDAPRDDALEDYWRTYYAAIFNPARLKVGAMQSEMPKRYWRNLPEAGLIPGMIADAQGRTRQMVAQPATQSSRRVVKAAVRASRDAPYDGQAPTSLVEVVAGVDHCRRCDLWRDATQGVPGQGPSQARLMLVGEQPGDQEDLAGAPFVGPAGALLDRALAEADVLRTKIYLTNAVKHFRHELRGKRRIHKTPGTTQVAACNVWLAAERRLVRPRVIVALGGTAALAVFGKPTPVNACRGQLMPLPDQAKGIVTYHPSYVLRLSDPAASRVAYDALVADLRWAWELSTATT